ncbi:TonB-dependent receptor plug domain-containing protein [Chryseobacterium sp. CFS15]|uniref:TonB-dependent receptor n=1 Tax=Chryseobacterium sp. CFS15 TaxID=2986946 RepID=UPI002806AD46|nr:TonB-dependent receptor plug domain-containing protein [Chryseobacterium sp. CFS15]MDQ8142875.1 TonB-dependent receptor [Chryseobacterium sp. CFS15]
MKGLFFLGLTASSLSFAQTLNNDSLKIREIEAVNFTRRLPVAKEIINVQKDLDGRNLGQDLPILLKNQTSIISTSDAGNGVGYTGFRIRGVAGRGINVMMNGVPFNDSESQGTFFVNVPDLTSSASQIVIQRGVGTSNNGVSAFGASINVISKEPEEKFYIKTDDSYGSFNTYKYSAEVGSGKFWKDRLSVMGRYSYIHSDGYIDRAFSDLNSYNFTALFEEGKTKLRLMAFGGKEKTYQAWNGIDRQTWETTPKLNYSGQYTDLFTGEEKFYDNETDNYRQNHYQFLWEQNINERWNLETTLHYTKGRGFYENYVRVNEEDEEATHYSNYNLPVFELNGAPVNQTDFIRKKWLNNDFYGLVSTLYGKFENLDLNFGLVGNQYYGRHYGNVTGVYFPNIDEYEYYRNRSVKTEVAAFAKALIKVNDFEFFGDLQLRNIDYDTKILMEGDGEGANLNENWLFFNPKAGVNYKLGNGKVFFSYAHAQREPNRDDLISNNDVKSEKLHDFEAGIEKQFGKVAFTANLYYMYYLNQLVLNGQISNIGEFIRTNSGKSYRRGLEIGALAKLSKQWEISGNVSVSQNRNLDFRIKNKKEITELGNTEISFSPNLIANLSLKYTPTKNFQLALMNQYVGKQYLDNTETQSLQLADYLLTDFNAQYDFKIAKHEVALKLLVNNIFNQKYVNNGYVYNGPVYFSQAGTNFMFGISWKIQ